MIAKLTLSQRLNYRNRGPDKRPLGRLGGFIQGLFSMAFDWKSTPPTKLIRINQSGLFWPPFIAINIRQGGFWRTFRAGWRWDDDPKYLGYIFDVIVKLKEEKAHI